MTRPFVPPVQRNPELQLNVRHHFRFGARGCVQAQVLLGEVALKIHQALCRHAAADGPKQEHEQVCNLQLNKNLWNDFDECMNFCPQIPQSSQRGECAAPNNSLLPGGQERSDIYSPGKRHHSRRPGQLRKTAHDCKRGESAFFAL